MNFGKHFRLLGSMMQSSTFKKPNSSGRSGSFVFGFVVGRGGWGWVGWQVASLKILKELMSLALSFFARTGYILPGWETPENMLGELLDCLGHVSKTILVSFGFGFHYPE